MARSVRRLRKGHTPRLNGEVVEDVTNVDDSEVDDLLRSLVGQVGEGLTHKQRESLRSGFDVRPFTGVRPGADPTERSLGNPQRTSPNRVELLDALVEVARLAYTAATHDDASLFDFECEALEELVTLGQRLTAHREAAREFAHRARLHSDLSRIYESLAAAWPPNRHQTSTAEMREKALSPSQKAAEELARAELQELAVEVSIAQDKAERLLVHGPYIRSCGGPARAAEVMIREVIHGETRKAAGALLKSRAIVSGYYEARANQDPFPESTLAGESTDSSIRRMAHLWSLIGEYQALAARPVNPQVRKRVPHLTRTLMAAELLAARASELSGEKTPDDLKERLQHAKDMLFGPPR